MIEPQPTQSSTNYSEETELLILGMMIHSSSALSTCIDALDEEDIYLTSNRLIFRSLKSLSQKDCSVDEHIVIEDLRTKGLLSDVGGIGFIKSLHIYSQCYSSLNEYIKIIKNSSTGRKLNRIASDLYIRSLKADEDSSDLLEDAQGQLFKISQGAYSNAGISLPEMIDGKRSESNKSFMQELEDKQAQFILNGGKDIPFDGVHSGFLDLDQILMGFGNSHLVIVAARPAMGKTAFALSIAERVTLNQGKPVGIFSLEMTADELTMRMICSHANVEKSKLMLGSVTNQELKKVSDSTKLLSTSQLIIDDQSRIRMGDLRIRARRMKERHGIGLLIIDYLQLISGSASYRGDETRQTEVAEISRSMKILAKELNIPIICLAQLSRKVEERADKKPMVSDLRESGALEQDADVVLLLSRAEVYDKYNKPGTAQMIVAKNRHGPTGEVNFAYLKEYARFENMTKNHSSEDDSYIIRHSRGGTYD